MVLLIPLAYLHSAKRGESLFFIAVWLIQGYTSGQNCASKFAIEELFLSCAISFNNLTYNATECLIAEDH